MSIKYKVIKQEKQSDQKTKIFRCKVAGQVLGALQAYLQEHIKVGTSLTEIDRLSYYFITKNKCKPSFLNYKGYPNTICASVNRVLIHAIPSLYVLKYDDLLTIDVGCSYMGFHADFAFSIILPSKVKKRGKNTNLKRLQTQKSKLLKAVNSDNAKTIEFRVAETKADTVIKKKLSILERKQKILDATKLALDCAIEIIRPNINLQQLSSVIFNVIKKNGYFTPKEFCGHGIGRRLHEEPYIGNIPWQSPNLFLKEGMIICVEPMLLEYSDEVILANDNWTVLPADQKALSCHLEHTILITQEGNEVLTLKNKSGLVKNVFKEYDII